MSPPDAKVSPVLDDPLTRDCPGRDLFLLATGKWTLLILWALQTGPRRFHQLRDDVQGISERVLSATLKTLVRHGLTQRHVEPSVPPKVSYELTPSGRGLLAVMEQLTTWIAAELETVEAAKSSYDRAQDAGTADQQK